MLIGAVADSQDCMVGIGLALGVVEDTSSVEHYRWSFAVDNHRDRSDVDGGKEGGGAVRFYLEVVFDL